MSQIVLPFLPRFDDDILSGRKTMTTRTRKCGEPGDYFYHKGARFVLEAVEEMSLRDVALDHYVEEGFNTPSQFIGTWNEIHPTTRYNGHHVVWAHRFSCEP